jgi:hypothetical protein
MRCDESAVPFDKLTIRIRHHEFGRTVSHLASRRIRRDALG